LVLAPFLVISCGRTAPLPLPSELPGGWVKASEEKRSELPPLVRQMGGRSGTVARYKGSGEVVVTVYETGGQAAAFELVQKWRPEGGKLYFHKGPRFVLLEGADQALLNRLEKAIEAALP